MERAIIFDIKNNINFISYYNPTTQTNNLLVTMRSRWFSDRNKTLQKRFTPSVDIKHSIVYSISLDPQQHYLTRLRVSFHQWAFPETCQSTEIPERPTLPATLVGQVPQLSSQLLSHLIRLHGKSYYNNKQRASHPTCLSVVPTWPRSIK